MHTIQTTLQNILPFLPASPILKMKFTKVVWTIAPKTNNKSYTINKPKISTG